MALKIKKPQAMLFTSDDRVLRDVNRVWLKPYFPDGDRAQVTCDFEERITTEEVIQVPHNVTTIVPTTVIDPETQEETTVDTEVVTVEYTEEKVTVNNDVIKGSIVINVAINLGSPNFLIYFHEVCIAELNKIFPDLEFEIVAI